MTTRRPPKKLTITEGFDHLVASILRAGAVVDTAFNARAALGRALAVRLDDPELEDKSVAGLAREYRAVIDALREEVSVDADDGAFGDSLPSTFRNTKEP